MNKTVAAYQEAFSPASLSCIFLPVVGSEPASTVSKGLRIALDTGLRVRVAPASEHLQVLNGRPVDIAPLTFALNLLKSAPVTIELFPEFPFSHGFGMSAAATLASVLAVNKLFSLEKNKSELVEIAHIADVSSSTGIGDVGAQAKGGVTLKADEQNPLSLEKLGIKSRPLYVRSFSKINTSAILADRIRLARIKEAAATALLAIEKLPKRTLVDLLSLSYAFASDSGMLRNLSVKSGLEEVYRQGGAGTMIMLGNAVVATVPFEGATEVAIGTKGARLL